MIHWCVSLVLAAFVFSHVIEGRVLDDDGQPVAGAHLWVSGQASQPEGPAYELIAEATSTEGGRFQLILPAEWIAASGVLRDLSVLVWKDGHGAFQASWTPDDVPPGLPFEPWLPALVSSEFIVEDEVGRPYRNARVYPTSLTYPDKGDWRVAPKAWVDAGLFETDELGCVTLPFPAQSIEELTVDPAAGGRFELSWQDRQPGGFPGTLVLPRPTERHFEADDPIPPHLGISVMVFVNVPSPAGRQLSALFTDARALDGEAPWTLRIPGEAMNLFLESDDEAALAYTVEAVPPAKEGERVNSWKLARKPEIGTIMGSAKIHPDGAPLEGVRLHVMTPATAWVTTDDQGRFEHASAGTFASVRTVIPPNGYVIRGRARAHARPDETTGVADLPPLELVRATWIRGRAVTDEGHAASGAWVTAAVQGENRSFQVLTAVAAAEGAFRLGPMAPNTYYELVGHFEGQVGRAVAAGTTEGGEGDVVQLTLEPPLLARANLTWEGAEPAPRVRLTLVGDRALTYSNVEGGLHANGKLRHACELGRTMTFERPLEPEGTYAIRYEGWSESDQRRLEPGITAFMRGRELAEGVTITPTERWVTPRLSLERALGEPATRILGAMAGADAGELRVRLRTSDDWSSVTPEGEFIAIGGESDPDILLVERDGFVLAASLMHHPRTGSTRANDDAAGSSHNSNPARDPVADVQLVERIAWARIDESLRADGEDVLNWLYPLMRTNPDGVLAFLDSGRWGDASQSTLALSMLAEALAPLRPDEALSLVRRGEIAHRKYFIACLAAPFMDKPAALQELAGALADSPENASPTSQVTRAALIARGLFELSEHESARTVIEPALEVAAGLPDNDNTNFAKRELGSVAYLLDREKGLELLRSSRRPSEQHRSMAHMAAWLAQVDPDVCDEALGQMHGRSTQFYIDRALPAIAYRIARRDALRALDVLDAFAASGVPYGLIALALSELDEEEEATGALMQAFDRVESDAATSDPNAHHPVAAGAFLLCVAEVIDPMGFGAWKTRALALPRRPASYTPLFLEALINAEVCLAIALADRDRPMARALIKPWIEALSGDGPRAAKARSQIAGISAAMALIYPDSMEAKLEEVPDDLRDRALHQCVQALAMASEPRGKLLAARQILPASWWPGERIR